MHYIGNMVLLQILARSFTLIILVSLIIPEYGYSEDTQEMNEKEDMLNNAPDIPIEPIYVKNTKGRKRIYAGGCTRRPDAPVNGRIKCSLNSGCTASCVPDYKFPNGMLHLTIICMDKQWHIKGTEWNSIPHCEPICMPECQNNGICIEPHHCNCPEHFTGPQCQFEDRPCFNHPPPVLNSYLKCNSKTCTISCMKHFTFPDGSSIANLICKDGNWKPTKNEWVSVPNCEPICDPPCQNGGNCLSMNLCQCPQDYRGPQCQYLANACDAEKLRFNGGYHCTNIGDTYSCTLKCPTGVEFEFPPVENYVCMYDKGIFEPQPIPQCKINDNIKIISFGTSYETYIRESDQSWSMHNTKTKHSQEIYDKYNIHGSNISSHSNRIFEVSQPKPKTCFIWGNTHYKTFDDKVYSFNSDCPHTLLRETENGVCTIIALNSPGCRTGLNRCFKIVKLFVQEKEYMLTSNETTGLPMFSSRKRLLPVPIYLPGLHVDKSAHFILVSLDSLGVKLKWDGRMLQIEASENMWNKTAGLCGTMNDDQNDEFLMKSGSYARSILTLADSWRVDNLGEICNDYPNTQHACELKDKFAQDASVFCTKLLSNYKFKTCTNTINFPEVIEACLWDYCACEYDDKRKCACDTIEVYIRQCIHKGIVQSITWRNNDTCPIFCDGGRIYMTCGPKVEMSCTSGIETKSSTECEEGCFCPPGTLEHQGKCVSPEECPCKLRGKFFQPGTSVPKGCNTCTCTFGKWVCTQIQCGARCAIVGDPHYTTFDGKHYDFMGKCTYYLMKGEDYTIESENVPCSGAISESMGFAVVDPSCTKSVTLNFNDTSIKLKQNYQVILNGEEITKFPILFNGARIRIASSIFVVVHLPNSLEVWWDGVSRVYINAPAKFHDQTKGLCGTFTENQKDDFATPDGDIEYMTIAFANKWKTSEYCIDESKNESRHSCELNPQRRAIAEEYCSKIYSDIFSDCHWYVDPTEFHRDCMYDMCACNVDIKLCFCPILAAYATDCAALNVKLSWRAEIEECKVQCSGGQIYQICGNSCMRSCADISLYRDCKHDCVEGCNCPEGQTLDVNGKCIPIAECPCVHGDREYRPNYREIRPGNKGQEFCSCINGVWECQLATSDEIQEYPPIKKLLSICLASKNLEVTDCEPVEQRTCSNMHILYEQTPSVCTSGCICKSGYVLDMPNGVCIKERDCPCHHGARSFKEGSVIQQECNTCTCEDTKWKCTDRICTGVCSVWGDSHYKTFDGKMFDFQGICNYVLVKGTLNKEEYFDISIQNVLCGTNGVTCSKSIKLTIGSDKQQEEIILTKGKKLPKGSFKRMMIRTAGLFVFVEVPDLELILQWDKGTRVYVKLSPQWKGRTIGLCGDYNDNGEDDFKTPSGGISEASVNLFGDSWKKDMSCPEPKDISDVCEKHPERKLWSLRQCNVLKSSVFSQCHSEVDVEQYLHNCIFDVCSCDAGGDCECLCTALAAYAYECNVRGIPVKWRTQELCPLQCDESCSTYSPCVSTCPRETCDNLMTVKYGTHLCAEDTCVEGCQFKPCPEGQVYWNASYTECTAKSTCTKPFCAEIEGVMYYEGDRVSSDDCQNCFCSRGKVTCKGEPCSITLSTITSATSIISTINVPLEEPQKCIDGWSAWINTYPGKKFIDVEPLPTSLDLANTDGLAMCNQKEMIDIKCRSVHEHLSPKESGLDVECSLERGLYCQSHSNLSCVDFEISVLCYCTEQVTQSIANTTSEIEESSPMQEECDITRPTLQHPTNCQLFYQCVPTLTGYELIEKSCGSGTLYNSATQTCDWPTEVLRIRSECSVIFERTTQAETEWSSSNEGNYENTLLTSVQKIVSTKMCKDGEIWSECAIQCTKTCEYYHYILKTQGYCNDDIDCLVGCVSIDRPVCPPHKFWRDSVTCVEANDCLCKSHDGSSVAPGTVKKESQCEICQCINNYYTCDSTFCDNTSTHKSPIIVTTHTPISMTTKFTSKTWTTISHINEYTTNLLHSTISPPGKCDETNYIPLIRNLRQELIIRTSSSKDPILRPEDLLLHAADNTAFEKFWESKINDANQWLDIEFIIPEPIYGVILQGSVIEDKFVTSYKILFSENGQTFSYILDKKGQPRVFRGSVDKIQPIEQRFHQPIEAKIIRINPLTWHNGIAMKVEILGCRDHIMTMTEQSTLKTMISEKTAMPICEDSMGLDNGLMAIEQVSVSSSAQLIQNLPLSSESVWRPSLNNPHQYVQFDFLETRNLTGITTKGGDDAWTIAYKVYYSNDGHNWNPVIDEHGDEREFLGNFNAETEKTSFFKRPLHARYLRIQPIKWHAYIALKIEILGCYLSYPTISAQTFTSESTTTLFELECNVCDGISQTLNNEDCRCKDPYWWNGDSCIPKQECPCIVGHVSYAVGSMYETEDCQECMCTLGGTAMCQPKKCESCQEPGLQSIIGKLCACLCKPCPQNTKYCPTSNVCVNETAWCDGVQDCPDDEKDCPEIISTTPMIFVTEHTSVINTLGYEVAPNTNEINPLKCEKPICLDGYRIVFTHLSQISNISRHNNDRTNVQVKGKSNTKTKKHRQHPPFHSIKKQHSQLTEDINCPKYICAPDKKAIFPGTKPWEECPKALCPSHYEVVYEKAKMYNRRKCPKYMCRPLTPPQAVCNITERTFNTFDNMEYKYDICNHILVRDMYNNEWYITLEKHCDKTYNQQQQQHCIRNLVIILNEHIIVLYPDLHLDIDEHSFSAMQIARLGNRFLDFELSHMSNNIIFISHHYGFWVIWDSNSNVKISVTTKLAGRVDGLCGYFDGDAMNDRRTPDGTQMRSTVQFGNSWAMENTSECNQHHVCPHDIQQQAWTICNSVKNPMLLDVCSDIIHFDRFVSHCVESMCSCLHASNNSYEECRCRLLTNFIGECEAALTNTDQLSDWRIVHDCPVSCPQPFIYQDCFRSKCEITCDNLHEIEPCPPMQGICFPGCFCPNGLVRQDNECVLPTQCRDCICDGLGNAKFINFGRRDFKFADNCTYLLSGSVAENVKSKNKAHAYQILITNENCDIGTCTEVITLLYKKHIIQIRHVKSSKELQVSIDNLEVEKFPRNYTWIVLDRTASADITLLVPSIQLELIIFPQNFAFTLKLPSHIFGDITEGLCGSCNIDAKAGFEKRDGNITDNVEEFGKSWLIEDLAIQLGLNNQMCSSNHQLQCMPPPADQDICKKFLYSNKFRQCHNIVDPKPYLDYCHDALCIDENYCDSLEIYIRKCSEAGLCLTWRTDEICPYECPAGLIYHSCHSNCKETCDTLNKSEHSKCVSDLVEGCFCPEDYVFYNDSCIPKRDCFICDKDGHMEGDIWNPDKCTECSCNDGIVNCQKTECPILDIICEQNMIPVLINGTEDKCCAKYVCIPKPTVSTICVEPQEPECGFGQTMKMITDNDGCHKFICQCVPINECPAFDNFTNEIEQLEPGFVQMMNTSGCCPRSIKICDPKTCPLAPDCPDYYKVIANIHADNCCPTHECVPPKDMCLHMNSEDQDNQRVTVKQIGEEWKDGKCKTCVCENSYDGPKSNCLIMECPNMNEHPDVNDYVLEEILLDDKCCPIFERTACKDGNKTYNVGEIWKPNIEDACITMQCDKHSDNMQKKIKVQECNTICDYGYEYRMSNDNNINCCGTCIQIACIVEGEFKNIGEQWYSDDHCVTYLCESANGSIYVQANTETCPEIDRQLELDFEIEARKIPGKCCPEIVKIACRSDETLYKPGDKWKSLKDNCVTETCMIGPNITKHKELEVCSKQCAQGWSYQEPKDDACCGECEQEFCVFEDTLYIPDMTWSSNDNCTTYTCLKQDKQLFLAVSPIACPDITNCPNASIYYDQCCKRCNLTSFIRPSLKEKECKVVTVDASTILDMLVIDHSLHGKCRNLDTIENITKCQGTCESSTFFDNGSWNYISDCQCCQVEKYTDIVITLICEDGKKLKKQLKLPSSCSCQSCISSDTNEYTKTKTKTRLKVT